MSLFYMKAVILAAGRNLRLKDIGDIPKTLLKIGQSTILERQIKTLMESGFRKQDIFVVVGYKQEKIKAIHDNVIVNNLYAEHENAYSVYLSLKYLVNNFNEDILILDGDLVYDKELIKQLCKSKEKNILVTRKTEYTPKFKDEIIVSNKNITEMIMPRKESILDEKYKDKNLFSFSGMLKLSYENANKLKKSLTNPDSWDKWYTFPLQPIVNNGGFFNFVLSEDIKFCFDIDTAEDYEKLQKLDLYGSKPYKMFIAGPVNVSNKTKKAMVYSEIGHRESEFLNLFKDIKKKLLYAFGVDSLKEEYSAVVVGGSGTSATETLLSSVLHGNKKTLVVSNGAFGERINEICKIYKIPTIFLDYGWDGYPKLKDIEDKLRENREIEAVAMVFMETSTGALNPVHEVGAICKKYNKIFIVDAISALGGEKLNMEGDNIDYCLTNTKKCLGGLPVLGIIGFKKSSLELSKDITPRSYYLDFFKHIKYSENNQTPFTPMIPLYYMLNQALNELIEEKIENRWERYKQNGRLFKKELKKMGLKFQLKEEKMSNLMVNVLIPENRTYEYLHEELKKRGYITYAGKGQLSGKIIHLANMGTLKKEDILQFCKNLREIL